MILVTGAPGWLGNRLLEVVVGKIPDLDDILPSGATQEIRCLVQMGIPKEFVEEINPRIRAIHADVCNSESLEPFFENSEGSILFHLAGIIHPHRGTKQIHEVNVVGTRNVLEKAAIHKVKRIIAVSSNSPIGVNPNNEHLFTEETPYNPYLAYGRSKMEMETLLNNAYRRGEIETVIIRPCWYYGPGQPERQSLFISMIKDGKVPIVGDGDNRRSLSYIDNTCQGLLLAAMNPRANGETYWIADARPYTMNEIVDTIETLLEVEFRLEVVHARLRLPNIASQIAYGIDWSLQKIGFYHPKIHVLSEMNKSIACSIEKAKTELGYNPVIELEEGMRRSIKWMIDNNIPI